MRFLSVICGLLLLACATQPPVQLSSKASKIIVIYKDISSPSCQPLPHIYATDEGCGGNTKKAEIQVQNHAAEMGATHLYLTYTRAALCSAGANPYKCTGYFGELFEDLSQQCIKGDQQACQEGVYYLNKHQDEEHKDLEKFYKVGCQAKITKACEGFAAMAWKIEQAKKLKEADSQCVHGNGEQCMVAAVIADASEDPDGKFNYTALACKHKVKKGCEAHDMMSSNRRDDLKTLLRSRQDDYEAKKAEFFRQAMKEAALTLGP